MLLKRRLVKEWDVTSPISSSSSYLLIVSILLCLPNFTTIRIYIQFSSLLKWTLYLEFCLELIFSHFIFFLSRAIGTQLLVVPVLAVSALCVCKWRAVSCYTDLLNDYQWINSWNSPHKPQEATENFIQSKTTK